MLHYCLPNRQSCSSLLTYASLLSLLQSLNYAPVAVGVVLLVAGGWWVLGARKWFDGPRKTVEDEEDFSVKE